MMKNRILIPALLFLHLLFCQVLCERLCYEIAIPLKFDSWGIQHLDNRGASPEEVQSGQSAWATAYGMRLFWNRVLESPKDSSLTDDCGLFYALSPQIRRIQLFNMTTLNDTIPPGSDVTDYFKYRSVASSAIQYLPLTSILQRLNETNDLAKLNTAVDLLCSREIAKNAWYQFRICLTQSDSSSICIQSDSIFLK